MKGKDSIWDVSDMEFPSGLLVSAHYRPDFFAAREGGVPPSKDLLTWPRGSPSCTLHPPAIPEQAGIASNNAL
jgi:hypothetical protein